MKNELIKLRAVKKSRKPTFVTPDSWKRKKLSSAWRRPKGLHSKVRLKFRGNPKMPSQGYRSPKTIRGFHPTGLKTIIVNSIKQLDIVKDEGIIIASVVGVKKKLAIIKAAAEKKLTVLNLDLDYVKKAETAFAERIKVKKDAKIAKTAKDSKKSDKKEEAKKETEEEKRKSGKKEMEKIITKAEK
ncbi:50S ribosomal protein L32e [Candidatus Woesearchaeota archaeon]|nr:50S ribosomal protein L32e [Candidatus Woesearchaeota archaeon]|tara:strand:+ start:17738 stop:18295 length:558 start_codon:yes stop_codon:yes gene_type:complete